MVYSIKYKLPGQHIPPNYVDCYLLVETCVLCELPLKERERHSCVAIPCRVSQKTLLELSFYEQDLTGLITL